MNIIEKYRPINSKEKVDSLKITQRCQTPLCKKRVFMYYSNRKGGIE